MKKGKDFCIIDWEDAFYWEGCPLCFLLNKALWRIEDNFLYELVNDTKIRDEIRKNGSFCERHTLQLLNFKDTFGLAIVFKDIIENFIIPNILKGNIVSSINCFFCKKEMEILDLYISSIPKIFEDKELTLLWREKSYAFCIPHLNILRDKLPSHIWKEIKEENEKKKKKYPEYIYSSPLWDKDYSELFLKKIRIKERFKK